MEHIREQMRCAKCGNPLTNDPFAGAVCSGCRVIQAYCHCKPATIPQDATWQELRTSGPGRWYLVRR